MLKPPTESTTIVPSLHSRELSAGSRSPASLTINADSLEPRQAGTHSPRFFKSRSRAGSGTDSTGDPKSAGHGHHRNTSIIHGMQHSRNGSAASNTSNPLSPQAIAAAGGTNGFTNMAHPDSDSAGQHMSSPSQNNGSADRGTVGTESGFNTFTQKRVDRVQSRSRREHAHNRSQSRHHYKDEVKSVGEYALHVLLTSVCTGGHPLGLRRLTWTVYWGSRGKDQHMCYRAVRPGATDRIDLWPRC